MEGVFWLIGLAALLVIEIITLGLTTIWFAGGALAAFLIDICGGGFGIQLIAFFGVSFVLLYFTRPFAMRYLNSNKTKTNYESLIGKEARVVTKIDNFEATGLAVVDGQEWTARAYHNNKIFESGTRVQIVSIQGVKLIVDDINQADRKN